MSEWNWGLWRYPSHNVNYKIYLSVHPLKTNKQNRHILSSSLAILTNVLRLRCLQENITSVLWKILGAFILAKSEKFILI